ncbi:MAG: DUF4956 domain-containing protein [Bacilli bacterium]
MLNSLFNELKDLWAIIFSLLASLVLGFIFSLTFVKIKKNDGITKDIPITFVVFPFVSAALAILGLYLSDSIVNQIGSSASVTEARILRAGIALMSVITMTRFRSHQRTTEEITYIFFVTFVGLACGYGYVVFACVVEVVLILVLILLRVINYPFVSPRQFKLKVTIPEDLNYEHVFDDIFEKYLEVANLGKIRTSDLGTMFTLNYEIIFKKGVSQKEFIDELRERNGNLNIQLTSKKFDKIGE